VTTAKSSSQNSNNPHFDYEADDRIFGKDAIEDELDEKYDNDFNGKNQRA
jgi:hypothetical protein